MFNTKRGRGSKKSAPVMVSVAPAAPGKPESPVAGKVSIRVEVTHEMIARRAYELSRSRQGTNPTQDWLDAEAELRNRVAAQN